MSKSKSFRDQLRKIDQRNINILERKRKSSKCYRCVWGKWLETKYYCMFPRCIK